mmetsp:Transcript_5346/g.17692  ORF Transcript_5346/g.17692 Transcript_5346/m.17692 type:complete len:272 (+) Transcript_5346:988-1803(+)
MRHVDGLLREGAARVPDLDSEVVARLVKGGVSRQRNHNVRLAHTASGATPVAVRLHRHEDRLGPSGRKGAARASRATVHAQHHRHHLCVHLAGRRVERGVQWVEEGKLAVHLAHKVHVLPLAVVDGARDGAVLPVLAVQLVPLLHQLQQLRLRRALGGQLEPRCSEVAEQHALQVGPHLCLALLKLLPHRRKLLEQRHGGRKGPAAQAGRPHDLPQPPIGTRRAEKTEDELNDGPLVQPPQPPHHDGADGVVERGHERSHVSLGCGTERVE